MYEVRDRQTGRVLSTMHTKAAGIADADIWQTSLRSQETEANAGRRFPITSAPGRIALFDTRRGSYIYIPV